MEIKKISQVFIKFEHIYLKKSSKMLKKIFYTLVFFFQVNLLFAQDIQNSWIVLAYGNQYSMLEIQENKILQKLLEPSTLEANKTAKTYEIVKTIRKENNGTVILKDANEFINIHYFELTEENVWLQIEMVGTQITKFSSLALAQKSEGNKDLAVLYRTKQAMQKYNNLKAIKDMNKAEYISLLKAYKETNTPETKAKARSLSTISVLYYNELLTQVLIQEGFNPFSERKDLGKPFLEDVAIQEILKTIK